MLKKFTKYKQENAHQPRFDTINLFVYVSALFALFNSYLEIQSIGVVSDQLISKSTDL